MASTSDKPGLAEALARAQSICAARERAASEVLKLLQNWGVNPDSAGEIINLLRSERYIDEKRFALSYITDKVNLGKWGMIRIRFALAGKGIPAGVIDQAADEFDQEAYRTMIRNELVKKKKTIKGGKYESKQRLIRFGMSRGYETDIVYRIAEEILK